MAHEELPLWKYFVVRVARQRMNSFFLQQTNPWNLIVTQVEFISYWSYCSMKRDEFLLAEIAGQSNTCSC
jgi:hypothetical protein